MNAIDDINGGRSEVKMTCLASEFDFPKVIKECLAKREEQRNRKIRRRK